MAKRLWSVLTDDMDHCYFTGSPDVERHHPNGVWFKRTPENLQIDKILKQRCQIYYESHYGTRYDFIKEFGKSYL